MKFGIFFGRANPCAADRHVRMLWRRCRRYPAFSSLAVALLLAFVVGLGGVTSQWIRAERQHQIAIGQRDMATENLYHSLVGQAAALRLARTSGYREPVLGLLQRALELDTPAKNTDELRQEAVACLGDFVGFSLLSGTVLRAR